MKGATLFHTSIMGWGKAQAKRGFPAASSCARTCRLCSNRPYQNMRGLLAEYGVILPQGAWRFTTQVTTAIEEAELSDLTREILMDMLDQGELADLRTLDFDIDLKAMHIKCMLL